MDKIQFSQQFKAIETGLKNFALKLAKNSTDAEDLVQQTAYKAFKGIHTFKEGTSFKSWSFTILKNTFITAYHKKNKRGVTNGPLEDYTYNIESNTSVHNNALSKLRMQEIYSHIEGLSHKTKLPFMMHVEGYKYDEIADNLNIPIGTVKSRINFARKKLKVVINNSAAKAA